MALRACRCGVGCIVVARMRQYLSWALLRSPGRAIERGHGWRTPVIRAFAAFVRSDHLCAGLVITVVAHVAEGDVPGVA